MTNVLFALRNDEEIPIAIPSLLLAQRDALRCESFSTEMLDLHHRQLFQPGGLEVHRSHFARVTVIHPSCLAAELCIF